MLRHCLLLAAIAAGASTMGCSEAVPPANQGAVYGAFRSSSLNADSPPLPCNLGVHQQLIGSPHATVADQINYLTDGEGGAQVFCNVRQSGSVFTAQALVNSGANVFEFVVDVGPDNNDGNRAQGSIGYRTLETVNKLVSGTDRPCEFWLNDSQEVAEGRAWLQFECAVIENASKSCGLIESTLAFQNCDS